MHLKSRALFANGDGGGRPFGDNMEQDCVIFGHGEMRHPLIAF